MKMNYKQFCQNGVWSIRGRNDYTELALEQIVTEYKHKLMFNNRVFIWYLLKYSNENKLTRRTIAKALGIGRTTLYKILNGERRIKQKEADILNAICLDTEIEQAFKRIARDLDSTKQNWRQFYQITD